MEITASSRDGGAVVAPAGRIDHASAEAFSRDLQPHLERCKAGGPGLVLDMSAVDYISSVGLRVLMVAAKQAEAQGGRIAIAGLTPLVREVFEISRFDLLFTIFDSVDQALSGLGAAG
jgi:anti-anti-sigma factor